MAPVTGTLLLADLLANKQQTPIQFGLDRIAAVLQADLDAHNRITNDMVGELADVSSDRMRLAGESGAMEMQEIDEAGRTRTTKLSGGQTVGFPLRLFGLSIGWDRKYFQNKTVADMARQFRGAEIGHVRAIRLAMQRALYLSANYTFRDELVAPSVDLPVKRLANADGFPVPNGPNAEVFDGASHQHYLGNATLTAGALLSLVNTVAEHTSSGQIRVAVNVADEVGVRALSGFVPYVDSNLTLNTAANQPAARLDVTRANDKPIGRFGSAEVWLKPWALANYPVAYDVGAPEKPLVYRTRGGTGTDGLVIAAELADYPLTAQHMEAEFGFGVWGRTSAAVLFVGNSTYQDPSI